MRKHKKKFQFMLHKRSASTWISGYLILTKGLKLDMTLCTLEIMQKRKTETDWIILLKSLHNSLCVDRFRRLFKFKMYKFSQAYLT